MAGEINLTAADTGQEHPQPSELFDLLAGAMRAQAEAGSIRASGICYDIRLRTGDDKATDAIAISLEHRAGDHVLVVMPYSRGRFSGWKFGDLAQMEAPDRRVFTEARGVV